jgi:thiol-disulfide isomerase/thioredoxin
MMRVVWIGLTLTAAMAAPTAEEWLNRVPQAHMRLGQYHLELRTDSVNQGELHKSESRSFTELAYAGPTKVRFESRHPHSWVLLVADGENLWRANRNTREYLRVPLEGPVADVKTGGGPIADMAVQMFKHMLQRYERIPRELKSARIRGEETVQVWVEDRNCVVIEAEYNPPPLARGIEFASRTFWIDKERHFVLREESITRGKLSPMQPYDEQESRNLMQVTRFDLTQPAEDRFVFQPDQEYVEVSKLEYPRPGGSEGSQLVGKPAPDVVAKTFDGKEWKLSELKGKTVLLDFWATWCGPCRDQMPRLAKLNERWKPKGLVLVGVNDDGDLETAQKYLDEHGHDWTNIFDGQDKKARSAFKVHGIPTLVLIDGEGKVVEYQVGSGEGSEKQIEQSLAKLLP